MTKRHDSDMFHRLRSISGVGKILALTILYEIHDIERFETVQRLASYARLVKSSRSASKEKQADPQWRIRKEGSAY